MISARGKFKNGVALPLKPIEKSHEEKNFIITFLDENIKEILPEKTNAAKSLGDLIAE